MTDEKKDALAPLTQREMTEELGILDPKFVSKTLDAINKMSAIIKEKLHEGVDYGVIPGTKKPTLFKPGAEKMIKLLGLSDSYEIMEKELNWEKPFFHFMIKCTLRNIRTGNVVSEGMGACNSMEDNFRWRWLWPNELSHEHKDPDTLKPLPSLKTKLIHSKKHNRDYTMYRVENEGVFTLVNTFLKMGEKRAMLDAALHAGRLSDLFGQDLEDIYQGAMEEVKEEEKAEVKEEKKVEKPKAEEKPKPKAKAKEKPVEKKKEERADTGEELGVDKEGKPIEEAPEEEVKEAEVMATDDQKDAILGMVNTLVDQFKRVPDDLIKAIHGRLVERFKVTRKKMPDDLTEEEAKFVIKGLNASIKSEHVKAEPKEEAEEPPVEF